MQQFELNAETRNDAGKGASRRLRRSGRLPGILYGTNKAPTPISLNQNEVAHQLEEEAFFSHILTINVDGTSEKVVLKDVQRHPYKPIIMHIDFQRIDEKEKITMRIPIHFLNEDKCPGVKTGGGVISHIISEIEVECLPGDLPEFIPVDVGALELNQTVHLSEIAMPPGVENLSLQHAGDADQAVVSVQVPRVVEEEEPVEAAAEALEPGAVAPEEPDADSEGAAEKKEKD